MGKVLVAIGRFCIDPCALLQQCVLSLLLNLFGPEGLWTVEVTLSCIEM